MHFISSQLLISWTSTAVECLFIRLSPPSLHPKLILWQVWCWVHLWQGHWGHPPKSCHLILRVPLSVCIIMHFTIHTSLTLFLVCTCYVVAGVSWFHHVSSSCIPCGALTGLHLTYSWSSTPTYLDDLFFGLQLTISAAVHSLLPYSAAWYLAAVYSTPQPITQDINLPAADFCSQFNATINYFGYLQPTTINWLQKSAAGKFNATINYFGYLQPTTTEALNLLAAIHLYENKWMAASKFSSWLQVAKVIDCGIKLFVKDIVLCLGAKMYY